MDILKIQSGVEGLDEVLGGGFPQGNVILISGLPGTMKSSLAFSILYHNATVLNLRCLFVTLEQSRKSLYQQMESMGFDVEKAQGNLHVVDIGSFQKKSVGQSSNQWMNFLMKMFENKSKIDGIDLVVLDSLEALEVLANFQNRRSDLFHFFEWIRDFEATSFFLTEAPPEQMIFGIDQSTSKNDEGYLSDGIIHLKMHQVSDINIQRRLRVVKMRSTDHKTGFFALVFENGQFSVTRALSV